MASVGCPDGDDNGQQSSNWDPLPPMDAAVTQNSSTAARAPVGDAGMGALVGYLGGPAVGASVLKKEQQGTGAPGLVLARRCGAAAFAQLGPDLDASTQ